MHPDLFGCCLCWHPITFSISHSQGTGSSIFYQSAQSARGDAGPIWYVCTEYLTVGLRLLPPSRPFSKERSSHGVMRASSWISYTPEDDEENAAEMCFAVNWLLTNVAVGYLVHHNEDHILLSSVKKQMRK